MKSKILSFQIPKSKTEFVRYQKDEGKHFYDQLHQHPQLQLTLIVEGKGQLLSHSFVSQFEPGDLFFFGANAAHVFRSDPEYFDDAADLRSSGLTVFFDFEALSTGIMEIEELRSLERFGQYAGACFKVSGESKAKLSQALIDFPKSKNVMRFVAALSLLSILSDQTTKMLGLGAHSPAAPLSERDGKRMREVMQFLLERRFSKIGLEEAAAVANLSKEAFCRFFKLRTQMTFTEYLLQLRIAQAQKLLLDQEISISEVAFSVGFENLSYFNRVFKRLTGKIPSDYRRQVL